MEIVREERTEGPVDKAGDQNLIIRGLAFPFHESAGEASRSIILFLVVYLEGKEIHVVSDFRGTCYSREEHRSSHLDYYGTVRLLGEFAGLDLDYPTVG